MGRKSALHEPEDSYREIRSAPLLLLFVHARSTSHLALDATLDACVRSAHINSCLVGDASVEAGAKLILLKISRDQTDQAKEKPNLSLV